MTYEDSEQYKQVAKHTYADTIAEFAQGPFTPLDLHTLTAAAVYNIKYSRVTPQMRAIAKDMNFMSCYGGTSTEQFLHWFTQSKPRLPGGIY